MKTVEVTWPRVISFLNMWKSNSNQAEDENSCKISTRLFIENIMSTTVRNSNFRVDKLRQRNTGYQTRMRKTLKCSKCRNHGRLSVLKGHKNNCPYRECACSKCRLVFERQRFQKDGKKLAAQMGLERSSESRDTDSPTALNIYSSENAAALEHSQNVSKGCRRQETEAVCSSLPSVCSTFKLPDPNRSTVVSAPPQLITTHKSTNSNDQNFLYQKTAVTTQIATRTDMACSVANSFTFAASNQNFRPPYPQNTSMQHGTWPLSHKGPLPDSSHAATFNPLGFPNHFADSRNSLKIRHLNLLARLFPQFSDIFINSVLEEARGELLAAAEWLVQLEDRRSFMYPTFDPFTPLPMLNPHFSNPNYTHNKTSYSHQASENNSKYLPPSALHNSNNRFDKDCIPQPVDLQSNIPKFFVTPQMMSAPGPPNMSCLLLPNENMHSKSSTSDVRPYSRLSRVPDSSQSERSAPKSFGENRLAPQQNYFIQSHQACIPQQHSATAKPTDMENARIVYGNDNSTGYASDNLTPDPNNAIAHNASMVASNVRMIANNANMVPSNANIVTNNASMRAVSVREIPHIGDGQEFNCTTQDHQATDEQQSKLHCYTLLSTKQAKEEDVEQKLSVISEYIIENDGQDGSPLHAKVNNTDYRENDMDSDVSSRDSHDSNLLSIH